MKALILSAAVLLTTALVLAGCKKKEQPSAQIRKEQIDMERYLEAMKKESEKEAEMSEGVKKTAETTAAKIEQTTCPVMDGNKIDKNIFTEYKGKKVYFCCPACKAKFEADPEKYVVNLPQFKQ